MHMKPADVS